MISNVKIYDLDECVKASGYPMKAILDKEPLTEKDWKRADKLAFNPIGSGHNNFLSGIRVSLDLKATNKLWVELQRYNFVDLISSQSSMHRICRMDLDRALNKYVDHRMVEALKDLQRIYNRTGEQEDFLRLVYSCPSGLQLTCRISTNYLQLKTIYKQRRNHRLPEWQTICDWIETLPHSEWITTG